MRKLSWVLFPFLGLWAVLLEGARWLEALSPRAETCLFLLWWISLAIIYDVVIFAQHGADPTITRTLQRWTEEFPVLLIALGALLWHLFGKGQ